MKELLKKFRRELHQIPEVAFEEHKTAEYIKEKLKEYGIPYEEITNEHYSTGTMVYFKGEEGCIAFRSDIDALPIKEDTGCEFASTNGRAHGCGHDGHAATLLTFAVWLKEQQDKGVKFKKSIVLIFQPGEEGKGGARYLSVHEKFLNKNIEAIFGMHLFPLLPEGTVSTKIGPLMAQTINLDIDIYGKGGHGAEPQNCIDTILITSKLIEAYQSVVSRNITPIEPMVLTIGSIHGGSARNIIPEKVSLLGTIRIFSKSMMAFIKERLENINKGFEMSYGVKIDFNFTPVYSPVINDENLYHVFREAVKDSNFVEAKPEMIAEDFSFYLDKVPGLFFFLGVRNEEKGYIYPLHNPKFNFDEEALLKGVETFQNIAYAMKAL